jgi:hypothetical protein
VHFQRRNRNADWILPFPNAARTNPDEILRPMSRKQVTQMEAELLAGRMMEVLSEEQPGEAERRTQAQQAAEDAPRAAAEAGAAQQ